MKSFSAYVASKFENKDIVRAVQEALRKRGHTITMDWTIHDAGEREGDELLEYLAMCAEQDEKGVVDADILFLIDHPNCKGAYSELGIALGAVRAGMRKHILVVGAVHIKPNMKQNIFHHRPHVHHFATVDEALAFIDGLATYR